MITKTLPFYHQTYLILTIIPFVGRLMNSIIILNPRQHQSPNKFWTSLPPRQVVEVDFL